jgi:uncharacterized protein (DUF608 family)
MYTKRYKDSVEVARAVSTEHAALLKRILAWQEAIYSADDHPVWLRESLVNILHLITKTGYWAVAQHPIGAWCRDEDGLFGMNECPRECPQIECIPCSFYGNVPVVYFFPELALATLRGYKAYQYPNGAAPWVFGGCTSGAAEGYHATDGTEMAIPSPGYQTTLNGPCYVDMVDRYWQRTGNDTVLQEFYPSVKRNTIYTMSLRSGPDGIVSVPDGNRNPTQPKARAGAGLDWFEGNGFFGMTPHVGGIHLAHLRIVQRMAEKAGDQAFAEQCKAWLRQGSVSIENKLWTGKYYLNYIEPETGKKSDLVFGYQLDGDWMCFYHGLPGVFQSDRARITLETIKNTCMALTPYGGQFRERRWDPRRIGAVHGRRLGIGLRVVRIFPAGSFHAGVDLYVSGRAGAGTRAGQELHAGHHAVGLPVDPAEHRERRHGQTRLRQRLLPEHDAVGGAGRHRTR